MVLGGDAKLKVFGTCTDLGVVRLIPWWKMVMSRWREGRERDGRRRGVRVVVVKRREVGETYVVEWIVESGETET